MYAIILIVNLLRIEGNWDSKSKKCDKQLTHIVRVMGCCFLFFILTNCHFLIIPFGEKRLSYWGLNFLRP